MVVTNQNFIVRLGQTKRVNATIRDEETGAALAITTQNFIWRVFTERTSSTPLLRYSRAQGITIVNAATGRIRWTISSAQSERLEPRHYYHALWVVTASGDATLAMEGRLEVVQAALGGNQ